MLKILLKIAVFVAFVFALSKNVDLSWVSNVREAQAYFEALGPWAPLTYLALFVVGALVHAPEIITVALGGVVFGGVMGFVYGWLGAMLSGVTCFLIGRFFFRDAVRRALIERFGSLQKLDGQFERHGIRTVMLLRLVLFLAPPMNWAVSATRVRLAHYLIGSALGVIPGLLITVGFANQLAHIDSFHELLDPKVIVPGSLFLAFIGVSLWIARRYLAEPEEPIAGDVVTNSEKERSTSNRMPS